LFIRQAIISDAIQPHWMFNTFYLLINILLGFGCNVLCYDAYKDKDLLNINNVKYVSLDEIYANCDIISIHLPLIPETHHLIDETSISKMKQGVMIINTSRGALIETNALIKGLKTGKVGSAGLDVYEEEKGNLLIFSIIQEYFFENFSGSNIKDDVLARLLTFNNVLVTPHQVYHLIYIHTGIFY
jgi:D-lactate dehydrogenase